MPFYEFDQNTKFKIIARQKKKEIYIYFDDS